MKYNYKIPKSILGDTNQFGTLKLARLHSWTSLKNIFGTLCTYCASEGLAKHCCWIIIGNDDNGKVVDISHIIWHKK